jgi:hypothetical protein
MSGRLLHDLYLGGSGGASLSDRLLEAVIAEDQDR